MSGPRIAAALAALLAATPAAAYVRMTDPETGKPYFWALPIVPYQVNAGRPASAPSCAAGPAGDPVLDAVRASFSAWHQGCAALELVFAGTTDAVRIGAQGTGENVVVMRHGWCSTNPQAAADPCYTDPEVDCGGIYDCFEDHGTADRLIVALTSTTYDPSTGQILDADIQVNGWDGQGAGGPLANPPSPPPPHGWYFTCLAATGPVCTSYGQGGCVYMDLQNTVTHEAGHFVGLEHSTDPATTMFMQERVGEISKRTLSADDVAGVCAIYPKPTGCASGGDGAGALSVLAGLALLRRRVLLTSRGSPRTPPPGACRR